MRNLIDFSSVQGLLTTLLGLVLVSLVAVGIRLLFMQVVQRRRERENRQINERLKLLIAAYKTLGGTFTGDLTVDPSHLRDLRRLAASHAPQSVPAAADAPAEDPPPGMPRGAERRRRVRDAVEAALSDVILLGTEEQVRLAAQAATDMAAGRRVETAALVVSLRSFIRGVLELEPIPPGLSIPNQGPLRNAGGGRSAQGDKGRGGSGGGSGTSGAGGAGQGGLGLGASGHAVHHDDPSSH